MKTQRQHEESGCTDYLQHNADSCPHLDHSEQTRKNNALMLKMDRERERRRYDAMSNSERLTYTNNDRTLRNPGTSKNLSRLHADADHPKSGRCESKPQGNKAQHSPLPWQANADTIWRTVGGRQAEIVCHPINHTQSIADAKLIVRAVNHADKLAEILQRIVRVSAKLTMAVDGVTFADTIIISDAKNILARYEADQ